MSPNTMTTVIGGGVIGLTTAYALVRSGHAVTLIERHSEVGSEASFANGGQLSYRYVSPLADAGVPRDSLHWLFKANSPIALTPRFDPHQWRWILHFLVACNGKTNRRNAASLLKLALASQRELRAWREEGLDDFSWRRPGKLVLYRHHEKFRKAAKAVSDPLREQVLSPRDCATIEPAFAHLAPHLAGGIFSPEDEVADCKKFCDSLLRALQENSLFQLIQGNACLGTIGHDRCAVTVDGKKHDTDRVVLAAGLNSRRLALPIGLNLQLYPLRAPFKTPCTLVLNEG